MPTILNLKCANCGANLEISPDTINFACGYCGSAQIVQRRGGTVSLKLVTDAISKVQVGTDKTAAELSIRRLKGEVAQLEIQYSQLQEDARKRRANNFWIAGAMFIGGLLFIFFPMSNSDFGGTAFVVLLFIVAGSIGFYLY